MEVQEVEVFIEKNGRVRLEVRGVKGNACLSLTKQLEMALGGQVESREMTPEVQETLTVAEENQVPNRQQQ